MAGKNDEPNWRSAAGGPARKGKQHGWQQEDPKSNVRTGTRRFKMLFLIGGGSAAAAGIVWLILLLMPGKRPGFLAIAADPREGIARLDVPYDPYGWLSAQRMLKWMTEAGKQDEHVPKVLAESPLWLDDQFDEWAEKVGADSNVDPVIVYIGLHGGVNADGDPILYTGRDAPGPVREADRPAIQLAKVLDKLHEKAAKKRTVVLLDVGRGTPDANLGEVTNDFARAVKAKLGATIAERTTLTVVLAAGDDERAWESSHLGVTALASGLLQSLDGTRAGSVGRENMGAYRADELVEAMQSDVLQWSKNNRATAQTLQMIPALDEWRANPERLAKYAERKFFKLKGGTPKSKGFLLGETAKEIAPDLQVEWKAASDLAARVPSPATYTPAAWRRYRELVLRFERASLAGDADGVGVLKNALRATRDDIERGLDLKLESDKYQLPLSVSLGRAAGPSLDGVPGAAGLAEAAKQTDAALANATQRPVEAHLPVMLNRYAREILKTKTDGPLASAWKPAVQTRLLAERAALGVRPGAGPFPYSERIWPLVASTVIDGDDRRRRGEDKLHGNADQIAAALADFQAADKQYNDALATAKQYQDPLRLRDEAFADLPFLSRWLAEADESTDTSTAIESANKTVRELWADAFELAKQLERAPAEPLALEKAARAVDTKLTELRRLATERAKSQLAANAASDLLVVEDLLLMPPPLVTAEERGRLLGRYLEIVGALSKEPSKQAGSTSTSKTKVIRRMHAIAQSLGGEWATWVAPRPEVPKFETTLTATDAKPFEKTPKLMAAFLAQRQRQADYAKYPEGGKVERAQAELFSRLSVPFAQFPNPEPSTINARRNWKALLEGQARRIALDHWYNENGQPYFTGEIAPKYLADARAIAEKLGERDAPKTPDELETERLLAVKPLAMKCLDADATAIRWTTESERTLRYALQSAPYGVPGEGILAWVSDEPGLIELASAGRRLVDLRKPFEGGGPQITVKAGPKIEEAATETRTARIRASGYFRGQRLAMEQVADVRINRRPDLVVTNVKPTQPAAFAVRTDRDFSPGAVSILLDYSKSMERSWKEKGPEKKTEMIDVLRDLLKLVPPTTDLKIHAFLAQESTDAARRETEILFDHERDPNGFLNNLDGANGLIQKLKIKPAYGNTPLLATMRETIDNMKRNYAGNRTLIVLTDGADTTFHDKILGEFKTPKEIKESGKRGELVKAVQNELKQFDQDGLFIQMVVFGEDDFEKDLAKEMFRPITEFERTPGDIQIVDTKQDLAKKLAEALRPRVRMFHRSGATVEKIPASGIPTNTTDDGPGKFSWRGTVRPDPYQFRFYRTQQDVEFGPGDAFSVRLRRDAKGYAYFQREIYFRDVERAIPPERIDDTHPEWHLAVPEFTEKRSNYAYLLSTAALESKIGTGATDQTDGEAESKATIRPVKPAFAWWELTRVAGGKEERFPGPVAVTNAPGLNAPAWRIVANNGSTFDGLDTTPFRLRVWTRSNDPPIFGTRAIRATAAALRAGVTDTIQDVTLRATLETVPFVPQTSVNKYLADKNMIDAIQPKPLLCLVVRVDDKAGRRFQVRVNRALDVDIGEHRYFYERDGADASPKIMAYTAVFGEISPDSLARLGEVEISLVPVSEIIGSADASAKPLAVTLRNSKSPNQSGHFKEPDPIDIPQTR